MQWLFHILFLTTCWNLVSVPVNGDDQDCQILPESTELNMEENSAAYYFSQSKASDDMAIDFLGKELEKDLELKNVWKKATASWKGKNLKVPDPLREEHAIAMTAYTIDGKLYKSLNDGVRSYGGDLNKYNTCFKLKSVHYLLSVTLDMLKNSSRGPLVYRGTRRTFSGKQGTEMRFGIFASTSHSQKVAEGFGKGTVFVVSTSHGAALRTYSVNAMQEEVLIPPYEKFRITGVSPWSGGYRYTLDSRGYEGLEVGLWLDGSGSLMVYSITPWWVWFLTALGILAILGIVAFLVWRCCD